MRNFNISSNNICSVVVTFNPDNFVADNIHLLTLYSKYVIVVDNGSNLDLVSSIIKISNKKNNIVIKKLPENLGIATALNLGISLAIKMGFSWIATFDQDSRINENYFYNLLSTYQEASRDKNVMVISPIYWDRVSQRLRTSAGKNLSSVESLPYFNYVEMSITSGCLIKAELFEIIGKFRDELFIDSVDSDFYLRCVNAGYKIIEANTAVLEHNLGEQSIHKFMRRSFAATNHNYLRRYYIFRNKIFMYKTYLRTNPKWVRGDIKSSIRDIFIIVMFEKDKYRKIRMSLNGIIDGFRNKFGKYTK